MRPLLASLAVFVLILSTASGGTTRPPAPVPEAAPARITAASLVRVNATNQAYHLLRPWMKRPPFSRRGTGVILAKDRILVTAELVMNHTFVELENPITLERTPASVSLVDYECNLALLAPVDPSFLADAVFVLPAEDLPVGTTLTVAQLEPTGSVVLTDSRITTVTQAAYPVDDAMLLVYRLSVPLQYRDNSFSLPAFSGDRLAGLLMRYDTRTQTADIVPDSVIRSFLARADRPPYQTFSRLGVAATPMRDPKFQRFLGLNDEQRGLYVSAVRPKSPAEAAGLKKGDVLLSVDGNVLDNDGNYEHPLFGKLSFAHYIATEKAPGETVKVRVFRAGTEKEFTATLAPRVAADMISPPFTADEPPPYFILGGLVLQELSRSVLKEWGSDWKTSAPQRLVFLDEKQDELPPDRRRIVFISQVLPSPANLGYEDLGLSVVEQINGVPIRGLQDIPEALGKTSDGFHRIEIDEDPRQIILDAAEVEKAMPELLETYNLGEASRF